MNIKSIWRIWVKTLGEKPSKCNKESDRIALVRSFVFLTYLTTNCFIVAGVIRHWDSKTTVIIQVEDATKINKEKVLIR